MSPLESSLRSLLKTKVEQAREIAQRAAAQALVAAAVDPGEAPAHLSEDQKDLRRRLRAHGRALGDTQNGAGVQGLDALADEVAYEHWHRMLFARFLAENDLLIHPEHKVPVSLDELRELAQEEFVSPWRLAGQWAARLLPQVFRQDTPVLALTLHPADQKALEDLLEDLPGGVFAASDALGWVYQYWQSARKDEINNSGVKIGAQELPAVTQLFTEPYMVSFLLDNALGAWWTCQVLTESDFATAESEADLRSKAAREGVPLDYLRFVRTDAGTWEPAAGRFAEWPKALADLRVIDPSCGSGHFLVALFQMLVALRCAHEGLTPREACDAVLRQNLHGLELDARCVELAVFALALTAWTTPDAGGYRELPPLQIACVGRSPSASREDWQKRAKGDPNLRGALQMMYDEFRQAPVLGSLLNPVRTFADKTFFANWSKVEPALRAALAQEDGSVEDHELGLAAQGLLQATTLLTRKYHWVVTNVPYLARGKQNAVLAEYCERQYPEAKSDLATVFLERCLELCERGGSSSIVLPQNWLFLTSYKKFREKLLRHETWNLIARLGAGAFTTISGEVVKAILISLAKGKTASVGGLLGAPEQGPVIRGIDVSEARSALEKAEGLRSQALQSVEQAKQLGNPDSIVAIGEINNTSLVREFAESVKGLTTGDGQRFIRNFWEFVEFSQGWEFFQTTPKGKSFYDGMEQVFLWENGQGQMQLVPGARTYARGAWGFKGVMVSQMGALPAALYTGVAYDNNCAVMKPKQKSDRASFYAYCTSPDFNLDVREIDQSLKPTNATFEKIAFDSARWRTEACESYPHGLPEPYSDDPTQWIFHGHPCGSVVWDEVTKKTAHGPLRQDGSVLQVAVARLLGYRWPAERDAAMELAPEQREWVERCQELAEFVDDDGIVCLSAMRGENPAADRVRALLGAAYGGTFSETDLLRAAGARSTRLEDWLRDEFFEAHCKLFQHRPFVWHIWDGLKDGFSALVNYHTFDRAHLETLLYTYLREWIERQASAEQAGDAGAANRRAAAEGLKTKLEKILEGERPHDIFVRWKSLAAQPIGWEPDLNDGVRLNIRPFLQDIGDVGKAGAGILRWKPNIKWDKDRGRDVESAPWFATFQGDRINDHHTTLGEKRAARAKGSL